jgi:hypothetical protein
MFTVGMSFSPSRNENDALDQSSEKSRVFSIIAGSYCRRAW